MLSAENIAAVKFAVELCNCPPIKREILRHGGGIYENRIDLSRRGWDHYLEEKTSILLENFGLPNFIQRKIISLVLPIGMRMLAWASYQEEILGISQDFCANFLKSSLFTSRGIIDSKKVAEKMINGRTLNIKQRYKLACHYCFVDQIPVLFQQMSEMEQEEFCDDHKPKRIWQPPLVKFWSCYVFTEMNYITENQSIVKSLLDLAIKSGNKAAVKYFLERIDDNRIEAALMDAAVKTVENCMSFNFNSNDNYSIDLFFFLLDKMTENQKVAFLKESFGESIVEWLLSWPYQDYCMKVVNLMWEFLPECGFAYFLEKICGKIERKNYVEDSAFNYRKLLKEFWCASPQSFKRSIFNQEAETCPEFLAKLLKLEKFTYEDRRNIELILESATEEEKINLINCDEGVALCFHLINDDKWERLDIFMSVCYTSSYQAKQFKRKFCFYVWPLICFGYAKIERWNAVKSFTRWSELTNGEVFLLKRKMFLSGHLRRECERMIVSDNSLKTVGKFCEWFFTSGEKLGEFKKKLIGSDRGFKICLDLLKNDKWEEADKLITWCHFFEDEIKEFKEELIFSGIGLEICSELVKQNKLEMADALVTWCLSSEGDIKEFKRLFAHEWGGTICCYLISYYEEVYRPNPYTITFNGGKWEQVEAFLTWCFSSEDEITDFKRKILLDDTASDIHFNLITVCKWDEAETFFCWLHLSTDESKVLKKEAIFSSMSEIKFFLSYSRSKMFSNWEKLEFFLRWCLNDQESVLEFQNKFEKEFGLQSPKSNKFIEMNARHLIHFYSLIIDIMKR